MIQSDSELRILLCDDTLITGLAFERALNKHNYATVQTCRANTDDVIKTANNFNPNVIIFFLLSDGYGGFRFHSQISESITALKAQRTDESCMYITITSCRLNEIPENSKTDLYLTSLTTAQQLIQYIEAKRTLLQYGTVRETDILLDNAPLSEQGTQRGVNSEQRWSEICQELEERITDVMRVLGFPAHIKGYKYVRLSILMSLYNPDMLESITKVMYPTVAEAFNTTPSRVERAIRHAIECAWNRADPEVITSYFGYSIDMQKGKPTNSEFIAQIADIIGLKNPDLVKEAKDNVPKSTGDLYQTV